MSTVKTTVSLRPAEPHEKSVVANLIQLYLYDITDALPFPIGHDGRFDYGLLEQFWQHPYLIFRGEELAGFALVIDGCPVTGRDDCRFMAEFFVLRAYRRQGAGSRAFAEVQRRHPGAWHLGVIERNRRAAEFWARNLPDCEVVRHHFDGEDWLIRAFTVP